MPNLNCVLCRHDFASESTATCRENPDYCYIDFVGYRPVCPECKRTKFHTCPDCGKSFYYNGVTINAGYDDEKVVCNECGRRYTACPDCGGRFTSNHIGIEPYCEECSENYFTCHQCGGVYNRDDAHEHNGELYCYSCHHDLFNHLKRYGHKPYDHEPIFWRDDDETVESVAGLYFGIEQETDSGEYRDDYCTKLFEYSQNDKLFVMKEDSSLDNGVEIVSYPCSIGYFNHKYPFEDIRRIANEHDFVSHNSGNCGLHIHVSRAGLGNTETERDLSIAKMMFLFDKFWDNVYKFSRRKNTRWCQKPDAYIRSTDLPAEAIQKAKKNAFDHCRAINLQHSNTVEFRIFRGSLNPVTVKAAIQFVYVLSKWVISHSLSDCQNVTWDELVASDFEELNAYLKAKNLITTDGSEQ